MRYEPGWLGVTAQALLIIQDARGPAPTVRILPLSALAELKAENLVSSVQIVATVGGEHQVLSRCSNSLARSVGRVVRVANKLAKGEEILPEDAADSEAPPQCPRCGRRYPDPNRRVCPHCLDRRSIFLRLLGYFPSYRVEVAAILFCMVLQAALELAGPYLSGRVFYDQVLSIEGKYYGRIVLVLLLMAALRLLAVLASVLYGRMVARVSAGVVFSLKAEIFAALGRLSLGFFSRKQTGALMNRVDYDALQLEFFFVDGMPFLLVNTMIILGISGAMLLLNWKLALLVFLPAPAVVVATKILVPRVWNLYTRRYRSRRVLTSVVNDSLTGVRVVKAFGKESTEISRFGLANRGMYSSELRAHQMAATVFPLFHVVMQLGGFLVWAAGGWKVVHGDLSFGVLMTFVGYIGMFYRPLQFFTRILDWWSSCMNSAQRIFEIVDARPEIVDRPHPVRLRAARGEIELERVTFAYEPNKPVIHEVSLRISSGEVIGLVGHTGAGKSTITNLITRLYDVQEGRVLLDGTDVRDIALEDLRAQIGIVLQTTYLFSGTVAQNIAYARPDASAAEIVEAARAANAHEFIVKLPDGYDTMLGRQGRELSGGERQRIAIARAILRDPRILILDEATSSVDTETEEKIQKAIERLVEGRTAIAIAHRLSTLRRADRLYVMEKGRIAESGTHAELMRAHGKYYELVSREHKALKVIGVAG